MSWLTAETIGRILINTELNTNPPAVPLGVVVLVLPRSAHSADVRQLDLVELPQLLDVVVGDDAFRGGGSAHGGGLRTNSVSLAEVLGADVPFPVLLAVARVAVQFEVVVGGAGCLSQLRGHRDLSSVSRDAGPPGAGPGAASETAALVAVQLLGLAGGALDEAPLSGQAPLPGAGEALSGGDASAGVTVDGFGGAGLAFLAGDFEGGDVEDEGEEA